MKVSKHLCWLVVLTLVIGGLCLTSCKSGGKSKSPTAPVDANGDGEVTMPDACEETNTCPAGGWLAACLNTDLTAYYLTSDGQTFYCTGAGETLDCDAAAWDAAWHCQNDL